MSRLFKNCIPRVVLVSCLKGSGESGLKVSFVNKGLGTGQQNLESFPSHSLAYYSNVSGFFFVLVDSHVHYSVGGEPGEAMMCISLTPLSGM